MKEQTKWGGGWSGPASLGVAVAWEAKQHFAQEFELQAKDLAADQKKLEEDREEFRDQQSPVEGQALCGAVGLCVRGRGPPWVSRALGRGSSSRAAGGRCDFTQDFQLQSEALAAAWRTVRSEQKEQQLPDGPSPLGLQVKRNNTNAKATSTTKSALGRGRLYPSAPSRLERALQQEQQLSQAPRTSPRRQKGPACRAVGLPLRVLAPRLPFLPARPALCTLP